MKKFAIEIKWGIRYTFCYLAWAIFEKFFGILGEVSIKADSNPRHFYEKTFGLFGNNIEYYVLSSLLFYLFASVIYTVALKEKKTNYFQNNMDWKQGTATGLYMTIVIAVLMPLTQACIHQVIAPEFFENMIALSKDKVAAESYFNLKSYIMQTIFFTLSIGMVISAIVSYFIQTKKAK